MIISDMSYLEVAAEAKDLEGGDLAGTYSNYFNLFKAYQVTSGGTPGGSGSSITAVKDIKWASSGGFIYI